MKLEDTFWFENPQSPNQHITFNFVIRKALAAQATLSWPSIKYIMNSDDGG